jgi:hypothetical protein
MARASQGADRARTPGGGQRGMANVEVDAFPLADAKTELVQITP